MMVSMRFEGGAALAKNLERLSQRVSRPIVRKALIEAGEPIRKAAGHHAPRRAPAPDLADNIVISNAKGEDEKETAIKIGPAKGFAHGKLLELGTVKMSPHPFLRPAFDANVTKALTIFRQAVWAALVARGIGSARSEQGDSGGLL